jgi:hypothetical protein
LVSLIGKSSIDGRYAALPASRELQFSLPQEQNELSAAWTSHAGVAVLGAIERPNRRDEHSMNDVERD